MSLILRRFCSCQVQPRSGNSTHSCGRQPADPVVIKTGSREAPAAQQTMGEPVGGESLAGKKSTADRTNPSYGLGSLCNPPVSVGELPLDSLDNLLG